MRDCKLSLYDRVIIKKDKFPKMEADHNNKFMVAKEQLYCFAKFISYHLALSLTDIDFKKELITNILHPFRL